MGVAVVLYFDPITETAILQLRQMLRKNGIPLNRAGEVRPHVSLAVFDEAEPAGLMSLVKSLAYETSALPVTLNAIGSFPGEEGVIFLGLEPTLPLLNLHHRVYDRLAGMSLNANVHYLPDHWFPHCTLAIELPAQTVPAAIEVGRAAFSALTGQFMDVSLLAFYPIKYLGTFRLIGSDQQV